MIEYLKRCIPIALLACLIMLLASFVMAADVKVSWNANIETDLAGYHLYQSQTSGAYVKGVFIADIPKPATFYSITGLVDGTYYWVLTAYDESGNESVFSDEVSLKIDSTPPVKPTGLKALILKLIAWMKSIIGGNG
jgi:opacity protein-like surface antigen